MEIIIAYEEWIEYVLMPFGKEYKIKTYLIANIAREMKTLGYANKENNIILNKNFTLNGFWSNFRFSFKQSFLDYIFRKMEELSWEF